MKKNKLASGYVFEFEQNYLHEDVMEKFHETIMKLFPDIIISSVNAWPFQTLMAHKFNPSSEKCIASVPSFSILFSFSFLKKGKKYYFSAEVINYWVQYIILKTINLMSESFKGEIYYLDINRQISIENKQYKNYLDFLKQQFPNPILARKYYLKHIKTIPPEILSKESGFQNLL